jgi:hypothetical protein
VAADLRIGLDELARIEQAHGFRFPPDLRALLAERGAEPDWFDWRRASAEQVTAKLAAPFDGVADYLRAYEYWLPMWGPRPAEVSERLRFLAAAPRLVPIVGNHFIATEPCEVGNPVFSIVGIDMIVAGCDLEDYLAGGPRSAATKGAARHIRFWSDVLYVHWDGWTEDLRKLAESLADPNA